MGDLYDSCEKCKNIANLADRRRTVAQVLKIQPRNQDRVERGLRLHKLRVIAGFTQVEFGVGIGWDEKNASTYVSKVESGERDLPREKQPLAAPFLATSPDLTDDVGYIGDYLQLLHGDLRGCIAARPRLGLVRDEPASDTPEAILYSINAPSDLHFRALEAV